MIRLAMALVLLSACATDSADPGDGADTDVEPDTVGVDTNALSDETDTTGVDTETVGAETDSREADTVVVDTEGVILAPVNAALMRRPARPAAARRRAAGTLQRGALAASQWPKSPSIARTASSCAS